MFTKRGYDIKVDNVAIGGTTSAFWSHLPNSLSNAVSDNPDCKWIWLSIGGNDGIYGLLLGKEIEEIIAKAVNDTRTFLDPLFADHPTVKIVQFGYDVVNFDKGIMCRTLGRSIFPECRGDIGCSNREMYNLQTAVEMISGYYDRHTSVNLLGTMQKASGEVPGPYPNDDYYTPADLMRDCIHPNSEGFDILFDQLWEVYFKAEVEQYYKEKQQ